MSALPEEAANPQKTDLGSTVAYGADSRSIAEEAKTEFVLTEPIANEAATAAGYEILQVLGRGAVGVVYKARRRGADRIVALKMILAGGHASEAELARFRTEAEAIAHLQHPNVIQVYEVGELDGCPYLTMEYVEGGSLQRRIAGVPQPVYAAAQLIQVLAETVDFAHQRGIAHRDLKPANVLLAPPQGGAAADSAYPLCDRLYGTPKIADFGLAKRLQEDTGQTKTGAILGTPSYMAPEQAVGKSKDVGIAADQYALGAILYEMLTGRPPFQGATVWETIDQVRSQEPVPPSRLQPRLPKDLETICLKALQKEPAKRYANTRALVDDLRRFIAREPILARSISRHERFWRWCRRNPVVAGLLALVCSLVLYGISYTWLSYYQIRLEQAATEEQRQIALGNQRQAERHAQEARASQDLAEKQWSLAMNTLATLITKVQKELNDTGSVEEARRKLLQEAMRGLREVVTSSEQAGPFDRQMGTTYLQLGAVFEQLNQPEDAYRQYQRSYYMLKEQARKEPGNDKVKANLATAVSKVGDMRQHFEGKRAAQENYREALRLRKELVERPQENVYLPAESRRELAKAYIKLAMASVEPEEAQESCQKAVGILKDLLAKQPEDRELQQDLAGVTRQLEETKKPDAQSPKDSKADGVKERS